MKQKYRLLLLLSVCILCLAALPVCAARLGGGVACLAAAEPMISSPGASSGAATKRPSRMPASVDRAIRSSSAPALNTHAAGVVSGHPSASS